MLKEILFAKKRKWSINLGIRKSLEMQGYRGTEEVWKKILKCIKDEE